MTTSSNPVRDPRRPLGRQTLPGDAMTVDRSAAIGFRAPAEAPGPIVLYLKAASTT